MKLFVLITLVVAAVAAAEIAIVYKQTDAFTRIWTDAGSGGSKSVAIWRLNNYQSEFCSLGDVATRSWEDSTYKALLVSQRKDGALVNPTGFSKIWTDSGSGADSCVAIYKMTAPSGYTCLGDVAVASYYDLPDKSKYCCVNDTYTGRGETIKSYDDSRTQSDQDVSLWTVLRSAADPSGVESGHFVTVTEYPPSQPSGTILQASESVKDLWSLLYSPGEFKPVDVYETGDLKLIWNDSGTGSTNDLSIWRAESKEGYYPVGDVVVATYDKPRIGFLVRPANISVEAVKPPTSYWRIWTAKGSGAEKDVALWRVRCPPRYVSLGGVATSGGRPQPGDVYCVNSKYASQGGTWEYVWRDLKSKADSDVKIMEAKASNSKQQPVRGFGAVPSHNSADTPPTLYLLNTAYINYWAEKPIVKMYVYNVQYMLPKEKQQTSPVSMSPTTLSNNSDKSQTITRSISYTTSKTRSFTFSQAAQVGMAVELSAGIPLIGISSKTTISASLTTTFESGSSTTTSTTDTISAQLTLPGRSKATVFIEGTQYTTDIPYTADVKKVYYDETTSVGQMTGVYKSVAVSSIEVKYGKVESLPASNKE